MKSTLSFLILITFCSWNLLLAKEVIVKYERGFLYKYKSFQYEDDELATSVSMGQKCEQFVQKMSQTFGVDPHDESDTKPAAINVCQQVAEVSNTYVITMFYLQCIVIM
jgi:hypothetical protein